MCIFLPMYFFIVFFLMLCSFYFTLCSSPRVMVISYYYSVASLDHLGCLLLSAGVCVCVCVCVNNYNYSKVIKGC